MTGLRRIRRALHGLGQQASYRWARVRYSAATFDSVQRFCLFVGYPRSGHSLLGAQLNAHPRAVIGHETNIPPLVVEGRSREEIYVRILGRATWFNLRGNKSLYSYAIPNQSQGRFERLELIGDKRGGAAARAIADHPDLLEKLRRTVGVPLRLIHVVRNPFDNISAISIRHQMAPPQAADFYFRHCETTAKLDAALDAEQWRTIHHEDLIADPRATLESVCRFVGLDTTEDYLADCSSIVFPAPTRTRTKTSWPDALRRSVEERAQAYPFLRRYTFD